MSAEDEFHVARSRLLDALGGLQTTVAHILHDHGDTGCETRPLGQKIETLKTLKVGPRLSNARKACIDEIVAEIGRRSLLTIRADIVHSKLKVVALDEPTALYVNAASAPGDSSAARLLSLKQHDRLAKRIGAWAAQLAEKC